MKKIDCAIIAAGGNATRFRPYSLTLPKEMLPLNGKPVIEYIIDECIEADIKKIIIEVKKGNECIKNHLSINAQYKSFLCDDFTEFEKNNNISILIVDGDTQYSYGNAVSILSVKQYLKGKTFCVLFGDDIILGSNATKELINMFFERKAKSVVATTYIPDEEISNYGNLLFDEDNKVLKLVQKPRNYKLSNYAVVSRLILDDSIFSYIDSSVNGENDIGIALDRQAQEYDVFACIISGEWVSVDSPLKYRDAMNVISNYTYGK